VAASSVAAAILSWERVRQWIIHEAGDIIMERNPGGESAG
jgi:hypothetical protein